MREFLLVGGVIVTPDEERCSDVYVKDGRVGAIGSRLSADLSPEIKRIDVSNCYVTPGLIDLQVNGSQTCNLWANPSDEEFKELCHELLRSGVTSFLPTLITDDLAAIKKNIQFLKARGAGQPVSNFGVGTAGDTNPISLKIRMPGIHLEGPFISPERPGVHPKEFIRAPNLTELKGLISPAVKLVTMAPEYGEGAAATHFLIDNKVSVALGHSNATFAEAQKAFAFGINLVTHTFNALPPLHHRHPGAVGAAMLDDKVMCCLIADGLHVSEEMVKILLRIKGVDRVVLVTDVAHVGTAGGGLVGSSIMLSDAIRNIVKWQAASFPEAIKMASANAAKAVNLGDDFGCIKNGGIADLAVWQKDNFEVRHTIVDGCLMF